MANAARTKQATVSAIHDNAAFPGDDAEAGDAVGALRSQVTSAFGELTRVRDELRERLQEFGEREVELAELQESIEHDRDELLAESSRVEEINRQFGMREEALRKREASVGQREEAVRSFQNMLMRMAAALDEPTPTKLSEAFEAATLALREGHAASLVASPPPVDEPDEHDDEAAGPPQADQPLDLSDLSPEERKKLDMLDQLGTATIAEIAATIRAERDGGGGARKKKGKKQRSWLF